MISLKSENSLLKKYIKDMKCQRLDLHKYQIKFNNIDQDWLNLEDSYEVSNKIDEIFKYINTNLNNYYYSYSKFLILILEYFNFKFDVFCLDFLLSDENESLLRKALVTIECSYRLNENLTENAYRVCSINIDSKLKWPLMDGIVGYIFKRYLNKIDPSKTTGLDKNSIDKYIIGDFVRKINDNKYPDLLPFGYLVGNNCNIKIILKDNLTSLDLLSFETLIPKYLLEDYMSILEKFRLVAINSLQKFGKTYLMHKLAQFLSKKY